MRYFYTADLHLGHARIIDFCKRPFATVEEMNETLVANWNRVVQKGDRVFVVGDFSMKMERTALRTLFDRLEGDKHLLIGNHDHDDVLKLSWASKRDIATVDDPIGKKVVLCHYGLREWPHFFRGALHFYGHSHCNLPGNSRSDDVGVDAVARYRALAAGRDALSPDDFAPVTLDEMLTYMNPRPLYDPHQKVY